MMPPSLLEPPIRVGFVLHVMQVAGAEVLVKETIRRLGANIVPTIFCLDTVGQLGEDYLAAGGDLVAFGRKPGRDFGVAKRLAREATTRKLDILHAHQYTPFFYSALAKPLIRPGVKLILTEHGRHYPDHVSPKRRAFNRLVLDRAADAVNACCQFSADALCRVDGFAGNRIEVIENGIAVERYDRPTDRNSHRLKMGLNPARRYAVHVARHHPVKDQAMLIRGFAHAASTIPDVDLLLAGDGPLRGELEALVDSLGIRDRTRFLGIRSDVPVLLAACDVFALTSVSEAASLTLLEAMASGLPVIVTSVGGNPEIVRHEQEGLLVPRADAVACGAAFVRLFQDTALANRLGAAARSRVFTHYRLEQTIDAYYALYRKLLGRTRP